MENQSVRQSYRVSGIGHHTHFNSIDDNIPVFSISRSINWPIPNISIETPLEENLYNANAINQGISEEKYGKLAYSTIKKLWLNNLIKLNSGHISMIDKIKETYYNLLASDLNNLGNFFKSVKTFMICLPNPNHVKHYLKKINFENKIHLKELYFIKVVYDITDDYFKRMDSYSIKVRLFNIE
jgi:hypothetical protein